VSLFGKFQARCYDFFMDRMDRAGGEEHRRRLVEEAGGEVLEIGAGTGKNLPLYGAAERVVALEPDPAMREQARKRAHDAARETRIALEEVEGDAMALPFGEVSFDTVVFSLVLCTVPDPERALTEACRVLRPGGTLRFYEHVRANKPSLAQFQDLARPGWRLLAGGCHPNRDTVRAIQQAGFEIQQQWRFAFRPCLVELPVTPRVLGIAKRP